VRRKKKPDEMVEMQMGPMIDMVFLLLVFFMVTAKPVKDEADISIGLPGAVAQEETLDIPDEQRIVIREGGQVVLNDQTLDNPLSRGLPELVGVLKRFKEAADNSKAKAMVTLVPDDVVPHQRIIDVLNACALAEINGVTFDSVNVSADGG
jgi:biopolymer transport protein ExbD